MRLLPRVISLVPNPSDLLVPFGWAMDGDPDVPLIGAGPKDPPRRMTGPATDYFNDLADDDPAEVQQVLAFPGPEFGRLELFDLERWPTHQTFTAGFADPEDAHAIVALFIRVCEGLDAAYGYIGTPDTANVWWNHEVRTGREAGTLTHTERSVDLLGFEQFVRDVYWVNYFGPAFVDRWGARLDDVGVDQWPTANGGRVVMACDDPDELEPQAGDGDDLGRLTDPAPKHSFYEALGKDTFLHRDMTVGAAGEHVPTVAEHRAATGHGGRALGRTHFTGSTDRRRPDHPTPTVDPPGWIVDLVADLRPLGWFTDDTNDRNVAAEIVANHEAAWGELSADDDLAAVVVAAADEGRVWWHDLEADVAPGSQVYERVVGEWLGLLNHGMSVEVAETWGGAEPVVAVTVDGATHRLEVDQHDDWIDLGLITHLNAVVDAERDLVLVEPFDQTAVVASIRPGDRESLSSILNRPLV